MCPLNAQLPELSLRRFSEELLHVSSLVVPLIRLYMEKGPKSLERAYSQFMEYKTRVPVCGAIMLNKDWTKVRGVAHVVCACQGMVQGGLVDVSQGKD